MRDIDSRLAGWNPVRAQDVSDAAATSEATALLHRVLSQPAGSPRPRWPARARKTARTRVTLVAAAAAAVGGILALVLMPPGSAGNPASSGGAAGHPGASPAPPIAGFAPGASQGVARNAIQLVKYAAAATTKAPVVVPGSLDWEYSKSFGHGHTTEMWQQVGTSRVALRGDGGKLTFAVGGGPGAQLTGWPGNWTNMYQYLASLPSQPQALRKVILANNHGNAGAAFLAINGLSNFPLPARFQAELYAVLVSLPGVHFFGHAVDPAGRHGISLYITGGDRTGVRGLDEIIINPRTYVYMGGASIPVDRHASIDALLANPPWSRLYDYGATLDSGIVRQPGQVP
jgi:hypothetical protein